METISLNEGGKVVGIGWGDDMKWIFVELKVRLFAITEG
jgi:hypothetical protein